MSAMSSILLSNVISTLNEVIHEFNGAFCWELVPYDILLVWLVCIQYQSFLSTRGACSEVVFDEEKSSTIHWGPD